MSTSNCANCKVTGLPVFPTLYAAVPSSVAPVLPDGIAGERVKAVNIEQPPPLVKNANKLIPNHATYKYGLRVARKGYLYVLYESGYKGKWQWDVYVVHGDGCLRLQPSALAIERPQDKLACETAGHQVARTHFFVIQDPENCEQVWLAFSEHKWTAKTLAQMADQNDPSGRTKRMQPFQPKAWLSGRQSAGHAAEATESTVSQVLDYRKGMGSLLAPEHNNKKISDSTNGRYSIDVLCSQASVHPVQQRDGQSLQLVKQMQTTGKRPDGKSHPPVLFALWDAIGVVRDLKGYRDDAGGWVAVYMEKERALQVSGMSMIDGAKLAMENAAELEFRGKRSLKATAAESRWRGPEGVQALRKQGATKPPPINEHYRETADLIADWESKGVPGLYVQRLEGILRQSSLPGWTDAKTRPPLEASRTAQLHALKAEVQAYLSKHSQSGQDAVGKAREQAWPRYEKLIVRDEARLAELRKDPNIDGNKLPYPLETFRANFNAFQLDADTLIDARTVHLVKWLESSLLLDTLLTFDKDDLRSGVEFSNTVSDAIFGIGSSASGAKKLDAWVNELKADVPANLFWRAFALNHAKMETNINQALQAATNNKSKFTESEFGNALSAIDFSKGIYDVYNRAAGIVIEEEGKARAIASVAVAAAGAAGAAYTASPTSQPLSLPKQMALADRLVLTAGDRLFKLFRLDKTSDWVGEKVMLHLMNVRALVEPNESQKFIKEEVAERVKIRAKAKVQAKLAALKSGHDKQMSSVQSLKGQIPDDEYEKLVKKVRNTYASKNQEAQNRKLGHHSIGQIERQLTDEVRQDKTSPLRMAWDRFQTDPVRRDEHSTLIRERRLVAIVTMLELVNLSKLIAYDIASQGKDDAKTYWSLAASGMTIAAGVADMTGLSIKYLLNDQSVSFKRLKLFSGGMAVGATWIGSFFDLKDMLSEGDKGRTAMATLYAIKSFAGFGLGVVSLAASATYAPSLVHRILIKQVSEAAINRISERASKLLLARMLGAAAGTWITLGLISIQLAIITLDDDALEKWCKNCPFGIDASGNDAHKSTEAMNSSLESAIYDVK